VNDPIEDRVGTTAGFISRALAIATDTVLLTVIIAGGGWVVRSFIDLILGSDPIQLNPVVLFFVAPVIAVLYFALSTDLTGRTPGKWLMGLRVVRMGGGDITLGRAMLRSLGYIVSLIPLGAGFLWVLVDDERRGWHDHIAGTKVQHQPGKVLARHTEP
jgi:uncharacterized RDD family membrane protein YckC